ncbi:hypothetical protein ACI2KH_23190, partial [Roseomonas mucosa]|uniref:hypothetical protein n=2 Tax=Roseomonas mucosa TaxID=207340 RepID=UPI003850CF47
AMVLQSLADGCPDAALTTGDKCDACHALALLLAERTLAIFVAPAGLNKRRQETKLRKAKDRHSF